MSLIEEINKEKNEYHEKIKYLDKLLELVSIYPDLKKHIDRWDRNRVSTKLVNHLVNDCEIKHSCGCCSDSILEVWPFIEINEIKIYSDPIPFRIGESNSLGYGEIPWNGWQDKMKENNISEKVVQIAEKYLNDNQPIDANEDEDD